MAIAKSRKMLLGSYLTLLNRNYFGHLIMGGDVMAQIYRTDLVLPLGETNRGFVCQKARKIFCAKSRY